MEKRNSTTAQWYEKEALQACYTHGLANVPQSSPFDFKIFLINSSHTANSETLWRFSHCPLRRVNVASLAFCRWAQHMCIPSTVSQITPQKYLITFKGRVMTKYAKYVALNYIILYSLNPPHKPVSSCVLLVTNMHDGVANQQRKGKELSIQELRQHVTCRRREDWWRTQT